VAVTKEIKLLEKSNAALSITVPKEDVNAQYNEMLNEYSKSLQIPGFRKGKVPKEVLERKFGDALRGDALGRIIESSFKELFEDDRDSLGRNERPLPYSSPEIQEKDLKLDLEQDLKFTVIYDVLPEVKIGQWKGLKVEYPYAEVAKEEIQKELEEIRERNAVVMDRDDDASALKGDVATIDYEIMDEDGKTPLEISRKDFSFTMDGTNIFKFDDDIIRMKKGDTKEFDKKFGQDFFDPTLAGKTRKMQITLTALKEKKLPDLDDDLAQDVDEKFKTLDDLKNSIKERLNKNLDKRLKDKKLKSLLDIIKENTPVIIPESMINAEVEGRIHRIARYYGTNPEVIKQMTNEEKMNEMREASRSALHSRLIMETLIEELKLEVTDEEVEKELERIAGTNGVGVDEVKKHYENEQSMDYLKDDIKENKMADILFSENNFKQGKKENYLAFMTDNA
jgi:trigger factor